MGREFAVRLSDEAYEALLRIATMMDMSPEQWAASYLLDEIRSIDEDPLLKLAGCIKDGPADLGERHDEYLGAAILEKVRGGAGA